MTVQHQNDHLHDDTGMSFLEGNHVSGRRRISQPSREEWLASLQQQIQEKDRQKQHKSPANSWAEPPHLPKLQNQYGDHHGNNSVASPLRSSLEVPTNQSFAPIHEQVQHQEDVMYDEGALPPLPGRMRVTRLSKEEWIESLQKQIQEKQQHKQKHRHRFTEEEDEPRDRLRQERAQSAVVAQPTTHVNTTSASIASVSALPQSAPSPLPSITGGKRRASSSMSREEYLKSLEEQIQEKKRLEERGKQKGVSSRRQRHDLDEIEDTITISKQPPDSINHNKEEPSKSTVYNEEPFSHNNTIIEEKVASPVRSHVTEDSAEIPGRVVTDLSSHENGKTEDGGGEGGGGAMSKILDLWDEMKKQNEDLKKQLQEQNTVLSSLQQTIEVATEEKVSKSKIKALNAVSKANSTKNESKETGKVSTKEKKEKPAVKEPKTRADTSKQKPGTLQFKREPPSITTASVKQKKGTRDTTTSSSADNKEPQMEEKTEAKGSKKVLKTKEKQKSIPSQVKETVTRVTEEETVAVDVVAVEDMAPIQETVENTSNQTPQIQAPRIETFEVNEHSIEEEELPLGEDESTLIPCNMMAEDEGELKSSSSFSLGNTESCFISIDDNNSFFH